jgi:hypothetical protein
MQIKTADGMESVASAGVGGAGLGLGIAGTALGLLNGGGRGLFGGLFGGGCCDQVSALQSELAKVTAERYADQVGIATFKEAKVMSDKNDEKIQANYIELAKAVAAIDKQVAVDKQATVDNFAFLNHKIDEKYREIKCYVDGTFVPGKLVMPLSSICPEAMQRYNSWVAPTTEATTGA